MDPRARKSDFDILKVDFEWVKQTKSVKELKQALAALREEGGYIDLEHEIQQKLESLHASDPKSENSLPTAEKQALEQDLKDWEDKIGSEDRSLGSPDSVQALETRKRAEKEKQKGNEHMRAKDYQLAVEAYTLAHDLDAENAVILSNRAQAHLNLKNFQKALDDCEQAIRLDKEFVKAHHRKGKALSAMQRHKEALDCFQHVLELEPTNTEAAAEAQKCRQHLPSSSSPSFKSIPIEEDSEQSDSEKSSPDTMSDDEHTISTVLSHAEDLKSQGNALFQQGQFPQAVPKYEAAMKELLELTTRNQGQINEAKATLFNNLAQCYVQTEELHKVIECCSAAVDLEQSNVLLKTKALLRRALAYEKLDKIDSAKRDMELVKSLDPGNMQASQALLRYSKILIQIQEHSAAVHAMELQEIIAQVDTIKDLGNKYYSEENYDNAILEFTAAIRTLQGRVSGNEENRMHPNIVTRHVALLCNRAACNLKLNCNTLVIQDCKSALALDENNVKALYRLSKAEENCGRLEEALRCLERVVEMDPKNEGIKKEIAGLKKRIQTSTAEPVERSPQSHSGPRRVSFKAKIAEQIPSPQTETGPEDASPVSFPKSVEAPGKFFPMKDNPISELKPSSEGKPASKEKPVRTETTKKPAKAQIPASVVSEAKTLATQLITDTEVPTSSTVFQTRIQSLKPDLQAIASYITRQDPHQIAGLFQHSQMDIDLLICVFNALRAVQVQENWLLQLLEETTSTYRFDLTVKMLSKSDKRLVSELISTLRIDETRLGDLKVKYKVD